MILPIAIITDFPPTKHYKHVIKQIEDGYIATLNPQLNSMNAKHRLQQDRSSNAFTTDGPTGFQTHIRGMWGLIVDVVQGVLTSDRTPVG